MAPGAVIDRQGLGLGGGFRLERRHRLLDVLGAGAVRDQHRVGHGHDDQVLDPEADQFLARGFGAQQHVAAVDGGDRARGGDAVGVRA